MQLKIGYSESPWHRPMMDPARKWGPALETACEEAVGMYYATREESLEGELCKKCFTEGERRVGAAYAAAVQQERIAAAAREEVDRIESSRRAQEESRERLREYDRRFRTGETAPIEKQTETDTEPDPDEPG